MYSKMILILSQIEKMKINDNNAILPSVDNCITGWVHISLFFSYFLTVWFLKITGVNENHWTKKHGML